MTPSLFRFDTVADRLPVLACRCDTVAVEVGGGNAVSMSRVRNLVDGKEVAWVGMREAWNKLVAPCAHQTFFKLVAKEAASGTFLSRLHAPRSSGKC